MSIFEQPNLGRHQRPTHARWATALSLAAVLVLAACGTNEGSLPASEEPIAEDPYEEDVVGPDSFAVASFVVEAEADAEAGATLQALDAGTTPFERGRDALASRGGYVAQPDSISASSTGSIVAEVPFDLTVADTYTLWVRMYAPTKDSDATYLGFDGTTYRVFTPDVQRYFWVEVTTEELAEGRHTISLGHGEPGLRIDQFAVTRRPDVGPEELNELVLPGESITSDEPDASEPEPEPTSPSEPMRSNFSLLADEGFSRTNLTAAERLWYDRTWTGVEASASSMVSKGGQDNSYYFGRTLFQYSTALLMGLRSTGDLRFLDALDPMMQAMRGELYDGWCDGVESSLYVNGSYGTISEQDGFVNFRWRGDTSHRNHCRDVGDLDETLTHGHLAMVMYAYHVNRDLVSPSGVDYGERADFWFDYLRNHFEAKWRERSGTAWPQMDFIDLKYGHTYHLFALYYYFMGMKLQLDGDSDSSAYLDKVAQMTDAMYEQAYVPEEQAGGFISTNGSYGDAVVYSVGAPDMGPQASDAISLQALPMTYSRYLLSAVMTLRMEGVARWDDAIMMRLSNGLTSFVLDTPEITSRDDTFAAGNSGSEEVEGMPPTTYRERLAVGKFGETTIPGFAVWDASGRIESVSRQVYGVLESEPDQPGGVFIPSAMLFLETATVNTMGFTASR